MNAREQLVAVVALAIVVVFAIAGAIYLTADSKTVPDFLVAAGAGGLGALAGIVSTKGGPSNG